MHRAEGSDQNGATITPFSLTGKQLVRTMEYRTTRYESTNRSGCARPDTRVVPDSLPATPTLMPVEEIRPGMVGIGRTVFQGTELQDFKVHILGVLRNVQGPKREPDPGASRRGPARATPASRRA